MLGWKEPIIGEISTKIIVGRYLPSIDLTMIVGINHFSKPFYIVLKTEEKIL
jgi:hypothetical protein